MEPDGRMNQGNLHKILKMACPDWIISMKYFSGRPLDKLVHFFFMNQYEPIVDLSGPGYTECVGK